MHSSSQPRQPVPITDRLRIHVWGISAAVATFALFLPTLRYGFVFDDGMLIEDNKNLEWNRLGQLLTWPFWAVGENGVPAVYAHLAHFYRPVISFSYLLDKTLFAAQPWGFHLTNSLMHALNVFLAYRVFSKFFPVLWQAAALALLFGVHPNNSEVVAAIHGRTDLFASVFCLGALLAYTADARVPRALAASGFSLLFALALGSKEQALLLLPLLAALHVLPEARALGLNWQSRRAHWAGAACVVVIYLGLRERALTGVPGLYSWDQPRALLTSAGYSVLHVLKLMTATLFPWGSYALTSELSFAPNLVTLEAFVCVVVFAAAFRKRPRLAVLGALWFAACVSFSVFGAAAIYEGEFGRLSKRYAHLAMPGLLWMIGAWLFHTWKRRSALALRMLLAMTLAGFCVQTALRNEVYHDSVGFWRIRTRELPNHPLAYYNLGRELMALRDHAAAAEAFSSAVRIDPRFMGGYEQVNLAICLSVIGKKREAADVVGKALNLFPDHQALLSLQNQLAPEPNGRSAELDTLHDLAIREQAEGKFLESLAALKTIHASRECYRLSRFLAGFAYQRLNDPERAVREYEIALRYAPDHALTHINMGFAFLDAKNPARACESFEHAQQLLPQDQNVAWGLSECRRLLAKSR